jgi:hypothetical protein
MDSLLPSTNHAETENICAMHKKKEKSVFEQ